MPRRDADGPTPRTTTTYAILGLLAVRDWTTYELAKQVQRSLNWFWPRAERKIYEEPKQLVTDGLATARKEFTGQRPRTVYAITAAGRKALKQWLNQPAAPPSTEFEAMVKVFFADAGSLRQLANTIDDIERTAVQRLQELSAMAQAALQGQSEFPRRQHISAVAMRLALLQETAVLTWTHWARRQINTWTSSRNPNGWDHRAALAELVAEAERRLETT